MKIIGRHKETELLNKLLTSNKSEFVALYGRRRVGKTYLIRATYRNKFSFQLTGIANVSDKEQLIQFHTAIIQHYTLKNTKIKPAKDWFTAFNQLIDLLERKKKNTKKIIFLDELPWLASQKSKFLPALEHFWNSWASDRNDIILVVCGSAASWMINKLINNKGGLHNRLTSIIKLEPFCLTEVKAFLISKNINYDNYQIVLIYMAFGGIPYYLEKIEATKSAMQNINELCFVKNAIFRSEYNNLYAALFNKHERHIAVIESLATKNKGLNRAEIVRLSKLPNGGGLSRILNELEESNFIRKYRGFGKKQRESLYQLVDSYSLFYLNFIKNSSVDDENYWLSLIDTPKFNTWSGYSFEIVCLQHIKEIKKALGINGILSSIYSWQSKKAQIDLIIDRSDRIINLFEIKFSINTFVINKQYADKLRNKIFTFKQDTKTKKTIFLSMITTYGIQNNQYNGMVNNQLTLSDLFKN